MKTVIGLGAAMLALGFTAAEAAPAPAPVITVLIKPGRVDPATSKGDIDITMTIPGVSAPAGQPFLSMGMFTPGLARPQVMESLSVTDAAGVVHLTEASAKGGTHRWVPGRAIQGVATV
jgi:hypothetical protein